MPFVILDSCLTSKDLSCVAVCPVDCIYELEHMAVISPSECIDCGACVPECPVEAIVPVMDVPPHQAALILINAAWDEGGHAAAEQRLQEHLATG